MTGTSEVEVDPDAQDAVDDLIHVLGEAPMLIGHPVVAEFEFWVAENGWWDGLMDLFGSEKGAIRAPWREEAVARAFITFVGAHTHEAILERIRSELENTLVGDESSWDANRRYHTAASLRSRGTRCWGSEGGTTKRKVPMMFVSSPIAPRW